MNDARNRTEASDPDEGRELLAVASLLRGLRHPEPPATLVDQVMAEVRRRESRPRVLRVAFRRFEPLIATAAAAAIGVLVLTTAIQSGLFPPGEPSGTTLEPSFARRVDGPTTTSAGALPARRTLEPAFVSIPGAERYEANLLGLSPPIRPGVTPDGLRQSLLTPQDQQLDRQLASLLLDPAAFYARIQQMNQPEFFVARLADRAARRGDAVEVAIRLRQSAPEHPQTAKWMDRLLRAAIVQRVPTP